MAKQITILARKADYYNEGDIVLAMKENGEYVTWWNERGTEAYSSGHYFGKSIESLKNAIKDFEGRN